MRSEFVSPTPWKARMNGPEPHIEDAAGQSVATCWGCDEPAEANAKLIVKRVNGWDDILAEKRHLAKTNRALAAETEKTWAVCDKLKDLLRRTVPCIESCIGHLRNDRATSLCDSKTMMVYTRTIENFLVLLAEVREALEKEASDGNA